MEWLTWLQLIILPAILALYAMIQRIESKVDQKIAQVTQAVAQAEIDIAKNYVSNNRLDTFERRITDHLIRIETKVDSIKSHDGQ